MLKKIKLGTYLEFFLLVITLGQSERLALFIAKRFFGKESCGCCERKEKMNRWTNPEWNGNCKGIKLF